MTGPYAPRTLSEVMDLEPESGVIRLQEQRVVVLSAAAMGLLVRELIDTLGAPAARRLMLRFGFADGFHDALSLRDRDPWPAPLDGLHAGMVLLRLEGLVHGQVTKAEIPAGTGATGPVRLEVIWTHSWVGEQHVAHYGEGSSPVCWSLAGYLSGFASACFGRELYFQEVTCVGQGHAHCRLVGQDADGWGAALAELRADLQGEHLGAEVERVRRRIRDRRRASGTHDDAPDRLRVATQDRDHRLVSRHPAMAEVLDHVARVAPLDTTVLVQGESGTGKELIVRAIHAQSARATGPFVSVNCAALTESLLESELFGHVRGAFTGAVRDKAGLFEAAAGGTLFLDEIGEMAPVLQAKLLRALQEREIRRVGGDRAIPVRARIVAATNRDLRAAVTGGTFREDLFYRLGAFIIQVPPLRDRRDDIPLLVDHFVGSGAARMGKPIRGVTAEAMTALMRHDWPGNVRELQHALERALILAQGPRITLRDLPREVTTPRPASSAVGFDLDAQERVLIERALAEFGGNRTRAAKALNISPVTLWRRMKRYGVTPT